MITMNVLRMLADVSFYGTFAGFVAAKCGGGGAFGGMVIQCLCFGLSRVGGNRRWLRLVLLLPIVLCWIIYRNSLADCILLVPTAVYILWLVFRGDYALHHERQQRLFEVFWKVLAAFVPLIMLMGGTAQITAVTIPYALAMLVSSVLLMRALRHEPRVYCQKKYQIMNLSAVALVVAAAYLISSKAVLNSCLAALKAVYRGLIQPVLEFLLHVLMLVIWGISTLLSWLFSFRGQSRQPEDSPEMDLGGMEGILPENFQAKEPSQLLRVLGMILLAAVVVVLLVLFFRWLNRRREGTTVQILGEGDRETLPVIQRSAKRKEDSPVRSIRAQYRKFLKQCVRFGVQMEKSSTSLDVHHQVSAFSGSAQVSTQIRELYIRARYAGRADAESVQKMKKLCAEAQKPPVEERQENE